MRAKSELLVEKVDQLGANITTPARRFRLIPDLVCGRQNESAEATYDWNASNPKYLR